MYALRIILGCVLSLAAFESLHAGTISVPADVSVGLTAEPNRHLQSGQRIDFTLSVTNHGPEPATLVDVGSSPIYDEFNLNTAIADCEDLGLIVVDLNDSFYYEYDWTTTYGSRLAVGETRYCHLNLEFTEWAPDTFLLTFGMPHWLVDADPTNNAATVTLGRETQGGAATAVPAASPLGLGVLAGLLAVLAGSMRSKGRRSARCSTEQMSARIAQPGRDVEIPRASSVRAHLRLARPQAMYALRAALGLELSLAVFEPLRAGTIVLPSDVSVGLTAEPDTDLQSGQRVAFKISVTNHGPGSVMPVIMESSAIYDELDVFSATGDCGNTLGLAVVEQNDGFYYAYSWFPTIDLVPLEPGETRYCHLNLDFTEWAPDTFSLTFSMPYWLVDADPTNNAATVTLRRETQSVAATPVPAASPLALAVLAAWLAVLARIAQPARSMRRTGRRTQGQWSA